jgi:cytochrome b561
LCQRLLREQWSRRCTVQGFCIYPWPCINNWTVFTGGRFLASSSEKLLYALMFAQPLVGWSMLSAGHYPIVMFGPVHLPPILPAIPTLYSVLRKAHTVLAYLLFLTFLAHLSAVLFHTLIIRDRLLDRMALWATRSRKNKSQS